MTVVTLTPSELAGIARANENFRQMREPGVLLVVPYLMFDAFIDSETRPNHQALDGGIAPISWTGWNRCAPPLGKMCRCNLIALTRAEGTRRLAQGGRFFDLTAKIPEGAGPDADWVRRDGWWERGESCGPCEWIEIPDTPKVLEPTEGAVAEAFKRFTATIQSNPGIIQTELYALFPDVHESDVSEILYYAAKFGFVVRKKKGRTYDLFLPA